MRVGADDDPVEGDGIQEGADIFGGIAGVSSQKFDDVADTGPPSF